MKGGKKEKADIILMACLEHGAVLCCQVMA